MNELEKEAAPAADGSRILFCKTITEEFGRIDLLEEADCADKYRRHVRSQRPYLNLSQTELERDRPRARFPAFEDPPAPRASWDVAHAKRRATSIPSWSSTLAAPPRRSL